MDEWIKVVPEVEDEDDPLRDDCVWKSQFVIDE